MVLLFEIMGDIVGGKQLKYFWRRHGAALTIIP